MYSLLLIIALILTLVFLARVVDDYFVPTLEVIAHRLKLSSDAAGATLMAVGSSAPELFVSLIAVFKPGDHAAIGAGTIVGSALFNILVIIGMSAWVRRAIVTWHTVVRDAGFYVVSLVIMIVAFRDGFIDGGEAILFVVMYALYVVAVMYWSRLTQQQDTYSETDEQTTKQPEQTAWYSRYTVAVTRLVFASPRYVYTNFFMAIFWIAVLSWILVELAVMLAAGLGVPEVVIALTVLAIGTSVPDLLSSIAVARKGYGGMAISNAIGSNIFDILFGLGFPWLLVLAFTNTTVMVDNSSLESSIILLFASVLVLLFLLLIRNWNIGKKSGFGLVGLYIAYLVWVVMGNV